VWVVGCRGQESGARGQGSGVRGQGEWFRVWWGAYVDDDSGDKRLQQEGCPNGSNALPMAPRTVEGLAEQFRHT